MNMLIKKKKVIHLYENSFGIHPDNADCDLS